MKIEIGAHILDHLGGRTRILAAGCTRLAVDNFHTSMKLPSAISKGGATAIGMYYDSRTDLYEVKVFKQHEAPTHTMELIGHRKHLNEQQLLPVFIHLTGIQL